MQNSNLFPVWLPLIRSSWLDQLLAHALKPHCAACKSRVHCPVTPLTSCARVGIRHWCTAHVASSPNPWACAPPPHLPTTRMRIQRLLCNSHQPANHPPANEGWCALGYVALALVIVAMIAVISPLSLFRTATCRSRIIDRGLELSWHRLISKRH
jgi:hypothetical protein